MKFKLLLSLILLFAFGSISAQVLLTNASPSATVNFSNTMQPTVGTTPSTAYSGAGFSPAPTIAGRLNSNAWEVKGWSFGDLLFGDTQTLDDFGRGMVSGGVITPGLYAYGNNYPAPAAGNPMMLIQPGDSDFAPGSITLRIRNNGTTSITQLNISYNLFVKNDENSATSFNFSRSEDNITFVNEPTLDYVSPDVADAFQWINAAGVSPSRALSINAIDIGPGEFYYLRWTTNDVVVSGERDEFGLDDISINASYGTPAPEINVVGGPGINILTGDTTPTVAEGTDFSPITAPTSTLVSTKSKYFNIQNLGGLPLNVTNITITGPQASDFTIFGATPLGSIAPAGMVQLTIIFDPSDAGLRKARVTITNNDSNEASYWFDIQGYGVVPIPDIRVNGGPSGGTSIVTGGSLTPNINNNTLFSTPQTVGGAGETKGWVIRNDCPYNAPVILTGPSPYITIAGANPSDFTLVTYPTSGSILPGSSRTFSIKFSPTASGIRTALVSIANNDPDVGLTPDIESPFVFLIQGTGVAPETDITGNAQPIESGALTTSLLNHTFFDYLNVATGTLDRTFTIRNSGNAALTIGALSITGPQSSDFSIISTPAASLAASATTTFTIRFDPSAVGLRNATVNLVNSDFNESPYTFAISGFGVDYTPCAFGAIEVMAAQNFEVTQAGTIWGYGTTGGTIAGGLAYGSLSDGSNTPKFLGTRSVQNTNGTTVLTMNNFNTSLYSDVELQFKLASLATTAVEGADTSDMVTIAISSNGGPWSNEMQILGSDNSKWSFVSGSGIATTVYDGDAAAAVFTAGNGYVTTNGYGTISLTNLPRVVSLSVRITLINNSAAEIWAIDNLSLYGRRPVTATWNGSWSPSAPLPSTKAIIQGNYSTVLNSNLTACECEIRAGATVTIGNGEYFNVESNLDNAGTLIIESGGSLVQHNDFAKNTGAISVRRNTTPMRIYDYTYWSSPVAGETLFNLSPFTRFDKYFSYDPVIGDWVLHLNGAEVMQPAKGYIVRAPLGATTTPTSVPGNFGGVPNNGFIQTPITIGADNMNLLGNPYPSAVNTIAFLSNPANTAVVEGTIYLWTHNTAITNNVYNVDDYAAYNYSGGTATGPADNTGFGNNLAPSANLASGQGFIIKGLQNNALATFNNSMRVPVGNNAFYKQENAVTDSIVAKIQNSKKNRLWLNLTNAEGVFKQTLVGYIEGATNALDRGYDGESFNANAYVDFYSRVDQTSLAIQGRALPFDQNDKVALGYTSTIAGIFEISIESADGFMETQQVYLEDKMLNITHDLKQSRYSFTTETGTFNDRFELKYTTETLHSEAFAANENAVTVLVKEEQITVLSSSKSIQHITVYDLLGRNVLEVPKIGRKMLTLKKPTAAQQTLLLKIVLENGQVTTRKVIL